MSAPWDEVKLWFERVAELTEDERAVVLERDCPDAAVRAEVLALLAAEARGGVRLDPSAGYRRSLEAEASGAYEDEVGRVVGPYRIDAPLGRGGMGTVWLAHREDASFEKQVAIKLIKRGLDTDEIVARFERERQVLASLEHPGIARLIDGGATDDGRPFMVLEYVEGHTIERWCREGELTVRERLELFRDVCAAVQAAHRSLVVHRDLKPSNILITADGSPKLLDFGIAKLLDAEGRAAAWTSNTGPGFMTPEFASPEQVRGETITTSTDVYSLGVVLFQLLTGRLPYRLTTRVRAEVERAICELPPERPSTAIRSEGSARPATRRLQRELAGDLDTIVLKALSKQPERRYGSVEQLSEDIGRHLDGLPVIARPDSGTYRLGRFVRRHRLGVAAASLVFVLMAAALLVITDLYREGDAARAVAEQRLDDLRGLTGELIFELHDEVASVPGATRARHELIATGVRYLDQLAAAADGDAALLRELAAGYGRLGDVQGRPTAASLGDSAAALLSHRRARALLGELLRVSPGDDALRIEHALALDHIGTLELRMGQAPEALAHFDEVLEVLGAVGDSRNLALVLYHRTEALASLGRTADALDECERCVDVARRQVAARSNDLGPKRTLETALFKLADLRSSTRDFAAAEAHALEAIGLAEELLAAAPTSAPAQRDLALVLALLARVRFDDGRAEEAAELVARQLALFRELSAADPADLQAQRDLSLALEREGAAHVEQGRFEDALASYRTCVQLDTAVCAADPSNLEWQLNLAVAQDLRCGVALELGLVDEAFAAASSMVELLAPIVAAGGADVGTHRTLALGSVRLGQLHLEARDFGAAHAEFLRARDAFANLAARDPEHAWTRRLEMVAEYFVAWSRRESGHDDLLEHDVRAAHFDAAIAGFARTLEQHEELKALGMLTADDEAQAAETRLELEACERLRAELVAAGG